MKKILRVVLIILLFLIGIRSLSFSQETEYRPLISGMEEYKAGNYQKALENFFKAEKIFPDDADVPFYLGLTYLQLNQKEKAIEYFQKTVKINFNRFSKSNRSFKTKRN